MNDHPGLRDMRGYLLLGGEGQASTEGDSWGLLRRALAGHEPSARALVQALAPIALRAAMRVMGRREDAEDAVQEAFLSLWRRPPNPGQGARLSTYLITVVLNNCRSMLRGRRLLEPIDDEQREKEATDPVTDGLVASVAMTPQGAQQRLDTALMRLSPRQRLAMAMWAYADATSADIARALLIDENAAHQLMHRARSALRKHMTGDLHER